MCARRSVTAGDDVIVESDRNFSNGESGTGNDRVYMKEVVARDQLFVEMGDGRYDVLQVYRAEAARASLLDSGGFSDRLYFDGDNEFGSTEIDGFESIYWV